MDLSSMHAKYPWSKFFFTFGSFVWSSLRIIPFAAITGIWYDEGMRTSYPVEPAWSLANIASLESKVSTITRQLCFASNWAMTPASM